MFYAAIWSWIYPDVSSSDSHDLQWSQFAMIMILLSRIFALQAIV